MVCVTQCNRFVKQKGPADAGPFDHDIPQIEAVDRHISHATQRHHFCVSPQRSPQPCDRAKHASWRGSGRSTQSDDEQLRAVASFFSTGYPESRIPPLKRVQFFTKSAW
ncbi:hypothetical protein YU82_004544 [Salmonella enterica subsp. salamae]|nr:hypothetical protein [Salmonella enterica subsp. salamae]